VPPIKTLELFPRTLDNIFVFNLFNSLLCGVLVLVVLRGLRAHRGTAFFTNHLFLFLAFVFLGTSFALGAVFAGALFFFQTRLPEATLDFLVHAFQASAWVTMAGAGFHQPSHGHEERGASHRWPFLALLLFTPLGLYLFWFAAGNPPAAMAALDLMNLFLLVFPLVLFFGDLWADGILLPAPWSCSSWQQRCIWSLPGCRTQRVTSLFGT